MRILPALALLPSMLLTTHAAAWEFGEEGKELQCAVVLEILVKRGTVLDDRLPEVRAAMPIVFDKASEILRSGTMAYKPSTPDEPIDAFLLALQRGAVNAIRFGTAPTLDECVDLAELDPESIPDLPAAPEQTGNASAVPEQLRSLLACPLILVEAAVYRSKDAEEGVRMQSAAAKLGSMIDAEPELAALSTEDLDAFLRENTPQQLEIAFGDWKGVTPAECLYLADRAPAPPEAEVLGPPTTP